MAYTVKPPQPPRPDVVLIDPKTGQATRALTDYLFKLTAYLAALAAAIP